MFRILLHIILPLGIGSLIYVLWRVQTLRVFVWFDALGVSPEVLHVRQWFKHYGETLPAWVLFSLPASLWMYSMVAWFQMALLQSDVRCRATWHSIALSLGVGTELGQLWGVVPGTFDLKDVAFYVAGWTAAILCTSEKEIPC